jgi:hypothetical protein
MCLRESPPSHKFARLVQTWGASNDVTSVGQPRFIKIFQLVKKLFGGGVTDGHKNYDTASNVCLESEVG